MTDNVVDMTPGSIRLRVGDRIVRIFGEAYLRGHGSPDFVAGVSLIKAWEDGSPVTDADREAITRTLKESATARRMTLEIE